MTGNFVFIIFVIYYYFAGVPFCESNPCVPPKICMNEFDTCLQSEYCHGKYLFKNTNRAVQPSLNVK